MPCGVEDRSDCCCTCKHHIKDFHHCTTVPNREPRTCHCGIQKGWICFPYGFDSPVAFSGWTEHGECECHEYKE